MDTQNNYRLTVCYDGTRYLGWQRQGGRDAERTIQGKLEAVLTRMAGEPVEVHGAGRTDAGVHTLAQVASFRTSLSVSPEELLACLNKYLPEDIAVTAAAPAPPRFHARLNARGKTYRYTIRNGPVPDVFRQRFEYRFPEPLDTDRMARGAAFLCGTHDFRVFSSVGRTKKSTVRTLSGAEVRREGELVTLTFTGTGFLYNMVRIMTGTLIEVGA
ncbi:MAG: tRNA pseudouridine(38-40) synthase TruA, partial [Oscillospiraceae bacterium]|nr:tRNA pseudouridine(38-40) synthase TruA [Oscillospiraceae bacterium]